MSASKRNTQKPWVDPDDAPELTGEELRNPRGVWKIGERTVNPEEGKTAMLDGLGKSRVNIHLDNAVINHFKALAGERGYQTLINSTLRKFVDRQGEEDRLRLVVREEIEDFAKRAAEGRTVSKALHSHRGSKSGAFLHRAQAPRSTTREHVPNPRRGDTKKSRR